MPALNLIAVLTVLCIALLAGFGWSIGAWAAGLLNTAGHIIALCVLVLCCALLVFGRV